MLQEHQATELADLKKVHNDEMQQIKQSKAEQEQRLEELLQQISKLKVDNQEGVNRHDTEMESMITEAAAAQEAALKVLQAIHTGLQLHNILALRLDRSLAAQHAFRNMQHMRMSHVG